MTDSKWLNSLWIIPVLCLFGSALCAGWELRHGEFAWAAFCLFQAGIMSLALLRTLSVIDHRKAMLEMFRGHADQVMARVSKEAASPWN